MAPDGYDTARDYQTILRLQIEEGLKEHERPRLGQFLPSLSCGLTLGIGVVGLLMFTTVLGPLFGEGWVHLLRSGAYTIGFGHLPHCVAGNIEVIAGMLAGADITLVRWAQFLALTTVGNVVGGVVFVALLNYSHIVWGTEGEDAAETIQAAEE